MSVRITGTGSSMPEYILTNDTLSKIVETDDKWITERTGILERRILTDEKLSDLAASAALRAVKDASLTPKQLDLIICCTISAEMTIPSLACLVQSKIGAVCPSFDINAACSGFLYGLNAARAFISAGIYKRVLLIAAEGLSRIVDYTDRSTCVLFGDGAGAVILEEGEGVLTVLNTAKGNAQLLNLPAHSGNFPFRENLPIKPYLSMNGQEVYKFAVSSICRDIGSVLSDAHLQIDDVDYFLLHQANCRIIESAAKKLKIPNQKILKIIEKYGNTSAACIPIMLDEFIRGGILKKGMRLLLSAFGGGLTTGAAILKLA